jgi:pyruvate dehydrogenase E1 component alpha subunit
MHRVIGETDLAETAVTAEEARAVYRDMVRARRFDERALALQRRGWMSSYPPFKSQEGSQVGAAHAMDAADWLVPTYRANAMQIALGVPMSDILLFRQGRGEYHSGHEKPIFPQAISIASQIPHAAGIGMAADYTDADHAVCAYLGDGATSEGDFHEGLNFAGVSDAPVVFFCENNGWAISTPRGRQTASDTIAQKATAYGIDGVRVDGNDPIAVRETMADALSSAREGSPVLVESLTYRQGAHTTSDDPSQYRDGEAALPEWRTADPLDRYEAYLREEDALDDERVEQIEADAEAELDEVVERAEAVPDPDPDEIFANVYAEPTRRLRDQRRSLAERVDGDGSGHPDE